MIPSAQAVFLPASGGGNARGVENRRRTLSEPLGRPGYGRSGGRSGSILPAASCNPSNLSFGLIRGTKRCQIALISLVATLINEPPPRPRVRENQRDKRR